MPSVLIVAFDGLQPAQVTSELMPTLAAFAGEGVTFTNHHAVFPTVTRINAASMVTGCNPGVHGLAANTLVMREFDPHLAFSAMEPILAEVAQRTGRVLLAPTLADILSREGQEFIAVGTGTSGNAYVHNPNAERCGGATIHPDFCLPYPLHDEITGRFGPWPAEGSTNAARLRYATKIMTEYVLAERKPAVATIWFSEPDHAQHQNGVGSTIGNRAIREADEQFGELLSWLDETGRAADTDVMVVSDHGYSTIGDVVDVESLVRDAGFPPGDQRGGVVVAPNGGSVLFYTHGSDRSTADQVAAWLMAQPWCGAITASEAVAGVPGTLPASLVGGDGPHAPELAMSFRWESTPNEAGYAGRAYSTSGSPGLGLHGSMSRHEMRNVLVARGPSFRRGVESSVPSGNVDVAPTVLRVLGLDGDQAMDGRPLAESLEGEGGPVERDSSSEVHEAERAVEGGVYRQRITVSRVGGTAYVDEGRATLD